VASTALLWLSVSVPGIISVTLMQLALHRFVDWITYLFQDLFVHCQKQSVFQPTVNVEKSKSSPPGFNTFAADSFARGRWGKGDTLTVFELYTFDNQSQTMFYYCSL
jgi:hypothetical protein